MKKILIIGAGFLQDFLIRKSKEMGYFTLVVDGNPEAIGFLHADKYKIIDIIDQEACLAYAQQEHIDGVLTAATDYGVLTASYIADKMNLPGLNYESAKLVKNKYLVRKCLFENNVDDTEQAYEINCSSDISALAKKLQYPVMVKPCDGSGSRGTSRVNDAGQLEMACKQAMHNSITNRAVIESFICGNEYGVESLVVDGKVHVLAIMKKWMTKPPYYAELGHAIPSGLSFELEEKVKKCAEKAITALGLNYGSVNMDLLITEKGGVHIVDIGARMGGNLIGSDIVPHGTGVDYMTNMLRIAVGEKVDLTSTGSTCVATRLLAFPNGIINRIPNWENVSNKYNVKIYHHLEIGQLVREYHTNLDGCGYVVATANKMEDAINNAEQAKQFIERYIFE